MNMQTQCQLWMGSLEPYMTESFLMGAFTKMGENPVTVKVMRNKITGEQAGYCFVHFTTDEVARTAMHKLNGKVIPNSAPPVRFKLNHAGSSSRPVVGQDKEYSLWVGDLSLDVDDYALYKCFAARYSSIRTAKVVLDSAGFSKGYAFVRFASEDDQKLCCIQMNGFKGLGSRPIKVSGAVPKAPWKGKESEGGGSGSASVTINTSSTGGTSTSSQSSTFDYTAAQSYYDPAAWQTYSWSSNYSNYSHDPSAMAAAHVQEYSALQAAAESMDDLELIDHYIPMDVNEMNQELINRDCDLWDAIESSKWTPVDVA